LLAESDKSLEQRTSRAEFLARRTTELPESIHDPVNIGNPRELRVLEIAALVLKLTDSRSVVQHQPLPVDDPKVRQPDIRKARALLGWEPVVTLEEGLQKTIGYFRTVLS